MEREILFKGRKKRSNKWITGDLDHICGSVYVFDRLDSENLNSPDWYEVDEETVCEFTGAHAINGDKIFEGHIVVRSFKKEKYVIEWYNCGFKLKDIVSNKYFDLQELVTTATIIGNIHDNPELLK